MVRTACGKKRFPSWEAANLELCKILARGIRGPQDKIEKRAYSCRRCDGWHLTSWEVRNRRIRW